MTTGNTAASHTVASRAPAADEVWPSDAELLTALGPWLLERRWFPCKDEVAPTLVSMSIVADVKLATNVRDLLIAVTRHQTTVEKTEDASALPSAPVLIHVPLVCETAKPLASFAMPGEPATAVGFTLLCPPPAKSPAPTDASRGVALVDGAHHPAFWEAWANAARQAGSVLDEAAAHAIIERSAAAQVMTGEQSNTNVLFPTLSADSAPDLVVKLFRVLSPGPNPDVEISAALAAHGWDRARRLLAWSMLSWVDPPSGEQVSSHSAVANEFIPEADDGFELFCALAAEDAAEGEVAGEASSQNAGDETDPPLTSGLSRQGQSVHASQNTALVSEQTQNALTTAAHGVARRRAMTLAHDLGVTTAQMHRILAQTLGEYEPVEPAEFVAALRQRAAWALEEVPVLREYVPDIESRIDRVYGLIDVSAALEPATRIHGDYHLGQVLRKPAPGAEAGSDEDSGRWIVLDFEGEPLRPLAQRLAPDQPLRDVAGMLRSFDYAAAVGAGQATKKGGHSTKWQSQAAKNVRGSKACTDSGARPECHSNGLSWLAAVRTAFLEGYEAEAASFSGSTRLPADDVAHPSASSSTVEQRRAVLAALELDKALYEAVYEAHNRPDWLEIPLITLLRPQP